MEEKEMDLPIPPRKNPPLHLLHPLLELLQLDLLGIRPQLLDACPLEVAVHEDRRVVGVREGTQRVGGRAASVCEPGAEVEGALCILIVSDGNKETCSEVGGLWG